MEAVKDVTDGLTKYLRDAATLVQGAQEDTDQDHEPFQIRTRFFAYTFRDFNKEDFPRWVDGVPICPTAARRRTTFTSPRTYMQDTAACGDTSSVTEPVSSVNSTKISQPGADTAVVQQDDSVLIATNVPEQIPFSISTSNRITSRATLAVPANSIHVITSPSERRPDLEACEVKGENIDAIM
jgi:hypothetical protein